ncbi:DUF4286 family protein [Thiotrichales bacterium 19S3-7]|nr:DUF4286 family protein [Thiotrichales bacterium 19S3-7]MCF6801478.1 DUF4286 family protein [Thiotrichales bacterium 19S3-11]
MIIYEVNLSINQSIFDQYFTWLKPHVADMLNFDGFRRAQINEEIQTDDKEIRSITVRYAIDSWPYLEDYLENHAYRMRDEGIELFKDQFSAKRKSYTILDTISINKQTEANII